MTDILMPALSPTMEEGKLAKWLVKEGDTVKPGDVIAEIETDKATMEVEAVDEGVIAKLMVEAGTEGVKVNAIIAQLSGGDTAPAPKANGKTKGPPAARPANVREDVKAETADAGQAPGAPTLRPTSAAGCDKLPSAPVRPRACRPVPRASL